ncbi:protein-export chaperone SecB [Clostridium sp. UBA7339]|uniref:protein-export chaperone SecB n=1 Tax=Clostridium sp. UBA7339 TaxID=1946376 RepID=UPI0032177ED1
MSKINSSLRFKNYVVESINFNTNFKFDGEQKEIEFDLDSDYSIEENDFMLSLEVVIFPEAEKNNYPFTMEVKIIGLFEIDSQIDEKTRENFIEKNSIAILFPYLRALVSVYSANANIGTLVLPPINVVNYLKNKRKQSGNIG